MPIFPNTYKAEKKRSKLCENQHVFITKYRDFIQKISLYLYFTISVYSKTQIRALFFFLLSVFLKFTAKSIHIRAAKLYLFSVLSQPIIHPLQINNLFLSKSPYPPPSKSTVAPPHSHFQSFLTTKQLPSPEESRTRSAEGLSLT